MTSKQNLAQNKPFLRALPAGIITHFMSRIYSNLIEIYYKSHLDARYKRGFLKPTVCLTVNFDFHPIGVTSLKMISTERIVFSS